MLRKSRAFHVQTVDPLPTQSYPPPPPPAAKQPMDLVKLTALTKHVSRHAAVTIGGAYAAKKFVDVAGEIALTIAKSKFK
jgi:hypothetical protein